MTHPSRVACLVLCIGMLALGATAAVAQTALTFHYDFEDGRTCGNAVPMAVKPVVLTEGNGNRG